MVKCSLFKDENLNKELDEYGYTKINFFSEIEIENLRAFYKESHQKEPDGFFDDIHMTTWCSDENHKTLVKNKLRTLFADACEKIFTNYRAINHVFILKDSGKHTEFNVHQDWSIVDETKYRSVNIWAPLYDVDVNSGSLWVLPESHKTDKKVRGAGILFPDYRQKRKEFEAKIQPVNVKAGEVLIFFHSTIHGSPPNVSDERRIVAVNSIVPKEAPLRIHFKKDINSSIEVYEPNDDFVYEYENLRRDSEIMPPKGKLVKTILILY